MKNLLKKCYRLLNNEKLVFAVFILYYIGRTGGNTSFVTQWPATDKGFQVLRMLGFFFFGIETLKLAIGYLKEKHTFKQIALMLGTVVLFAALAMNFIVQGAYTFLTDMMMAFVMSHIALRKTISVRMIVLFATCMFVPLLSNFGLLENLVTTRGETMRYALGFDYTTRISGIYGFATLYYCYLRKFKLTWRDIFMMVFSSLLIDFLTDTRTYFFLEIGFAIIAILVKLHVVQKCKKAYLVVEQLFVHLFPIASIATLFFTVAYGQGGIFIKLDEILTNRLAQVYADLVNYGIHLFGTSFAQYGNGGAHAAITSVFGSNYIDSGFLQLLIVRGLIPFVLIVIFLAIALDQMYKHHMHQELFVALIITLLSTFSGGLMSNESVLFIFMFYGLRLLYTSSSRKEILHEN